MINTQNEDMKTLIAEMTADGFERLTIAALVNYVERKYTPGGFLTAVLENNLFLAVSRADSQNRPRLQRLCVLIATYLPNGSFGYAGAVEQWVNQK